MKSPSTLRELQKCLGFLNHYRKFLPNLARTLYPVQRHLKCTKRKQNNVKILWTEEDEHILRQAIASVADATLLSHPDFSTQFILSTDASDVAIGAALEQEIDGVRKPIGFYSRALQKTEQKYDTFSRELLAVHDAVRHFITIIGSAQFLVLTDHKPLIPVLTNLMASTDKYPARVSRQLARLSEWSFDVRHISGMDNIIADTLSRPDTTRTKAFPTSDTPQASSPPPTTELNLIRIPQNILDPHTLGAQQRADEHIQRSIQRQPQKFTSKLWQNTPIIFYTGTSTPKPVIPASLQRSLFNSFHSLSHPGIKATARLINERFWGHQLMSKVK